MKYKQKCIALVNDITGFGRCSITVELPLISAMRIQACPLPTAILPVHTGFEDHYLDDYTQRMEAYIDNWQRNQLEFDGICTGFLGSLEQIAIVEDFIHRFKGSDTQVMMDPVMGDYGELYSSYTPEMCRELRRLLNLSDLVTPNLTEACRLLDIEYPEEGRANDAMLEQMAKALSQMGPEKVVITGLSDGQSVKNFVYEKNRNPVVITEPKVGGDRCGTGDVFAAIVAGALVNGLSLEAAVTKAAKFITKCMIHTVELDLPWTHGLAFEEYLTEL